MNCLSLRNHWLSGTFPVFKVEAFNALQHNLALPSIYASLKTTFQNATQIEDEDITWSAQYNLPAIETDERKALPL